jgi:hypothetical protein
LRRKANIMTTTNTTNEQMELGFNGVRLASKAMGRHGRIARASWWFAQMREIVNRAVESAEPRPEQIWMPGTTREVKV